MTKNKKIYKYTKCSRCSADKKEDIYNYCKCCIKEYNKNYNNASKGYFLYIVINSNEILYIGKTSRIDKRVSQHVTCKVPSTKHIFTSKEWTKIKYIDLTGIVVDDVELRVLENELINLHKPCCNVVTSTNYLLHNSRLFELITAIHSKVWKTYKKNCKKIAQLLAVTKLDKK